MEEKDDLMKNIMDDNSKNLKKYLVIGGATFVIFVVGIVIAKFAFGSSKDNTQIILPPESSSSNTKNQKEASDLFNSINVEKGENTDKKIQTQKESSLETSDEFKKPEPLKNIDSVKEETENNIEKIKEKVNKKAEAIQEKVKNNIEEAKKIANENIKNVKIVVKDKKQNIEEKKNNVVRNYYIQVAAITRGEPSKKFLGLIKQNGFNYKVVEIEIKGRKIKRVLVGPFTAEEAKNSLPKVKEKITTSAFIKKLR